MPAANQNFSIYQGDDLGPIFTAQNADGSPIDISTVADIQWIGYRGSMTSPLISKKKSLGNIVFVTNGADGQLQVLIDKVDSVALDWGWYYHSLILTDAFGDTITIATGRFAVLQRGMTS